MYTSFEQTLWIHTLGKRFVKLTDLWKTVWKRMNMARLALDLSQWTKINNSIQKLLGKSKTFSAVHGLQTHDDSNSLQPKSTSQSQIETYEHLHFFQKKWLSNHGLGKCSDKIWEDSATQNIRAVARSENPGG